MVSFFFRVCWVVGLTSRFGGGKGEKAPPTYHLQPKNEGQDRSKWNVFMKRVPLTVSSTHPISSYPLRYFP